MKDILNRIKGGVDRLFYGRQGMDELSKAFFWWGLVGILLSLLIGSVLNGVPSSVISALSLFLMIAAFVRAFSRRVGRREAENEAFLAYLSGLARKGEARRERFRQRREYRFFKCPGCGAMVRVPRGKGRIHINCRCGYQLYRRT